MLGQNVEHLLALSPMPCGLLCPEPHICTSNALSGGPRKDSVPRAGPSPTKVPTYPLAQVRSPGRLVGRESNRLKVKDQHLFRQLLLPPHLVHKHRSGSLLELLKGNLLLRSFWRDLALTGSSLGIFLMKTWTFIHLADCEEESDSSFFFCPITHPMGLGQGSTGSYWGADTSCGVGAGPASLFYGPLCCVANIRVKIHPH